MKITLIGNKGFDTIEYHTADALRHLGHEVVHLDMSDFFNVKYLHNYWFAKFIPGYNDKMFTALASKVIDFKPDLIIATYRFISAEAIRKLKDNLKGVPVVQLNPDALTTFEKQQIFYSPYDFYFAKDPYIVDFMRNKAELNAHYLPEAFNHRIHKMPDKDRAILESETNIDVVSFGAIYPYRARMIKRLVESGLKVSIFGKSQTTDQELKELFTNEWITGERKSSILVGSKIVFNNFHYAEVDSVNCKFFEIAGIGGFQICDNKPTVKEYSGIDTSKFTFNNMDEAVERIKFYIEKPDLRYELSNIQRQHFLENHTYDIRVQQMLNIIFK